MNYETERERDGASLTLARDTVATSMPLPRVCVRAGPSVEGDALRALEFAQLELCVELDRGRAVRCGGFARVWLRRGESRGSVRGEELLDEEHKGEAPEESERDRRRRELRMVWGARCLDECLDAPVKVGGGAR